MWRFTNRRRVKEELRHLLKFLVEYFEVEIQTVVVYGSFLRWSFRKDSDVDVAIILGDFPKWQWSSSGSFWDACNDSSHRQDFFRKLEQFLKGLSASHPYDIKVFTTRDLVLLEEFQKRVVHTRGNLVPSIRNGRVIFQRKENAVAEIKKGHRSFIEFLNQELPVHYLDIEAHHYYRECDRRAGLADQGWSKGCPSTSSEGSRGISGASDTRRQVRERSLRTQGSAGVLTTNQRGAARAAPLF